MVSLLVALPDAVEDPTEEELLGTSEKIADMVEQERRQPGVFRPSNLGALPDLWLQAKLTISLKQFQDKCTRLLVAVAAELCVAKRHRSYRRHRQ